MTGSLNLKERIDEFVRDATKIADHGKEAQSHLAAGDEQAACDVISMAHYPMNHVERDWEGIMQAFDAKGTKPGVRN